jgi:RNA polymerase sigma factor FliA
MTITAPAPPLRRPATPADHTPVVIGFGGPPTTPLPAPSQLDDTQIVQTYGSVVDSVIARLPYTVRRGATADADDLRQEGLLALLHAARRFDPAQGTPFSAYARTCVYNAIASTLRHLDPVPDRVRKDIRACRAAEDTLGSAATAAQIATLAQITPERVRAARTWAQRATPAPDDAIAELSDHPSRSPERCAQGREEGRALREAIRSLPPQHRRILLARLLEGTPVASIAASEGLSPARVSQVCTRTVTKLAALL